jgi:hypothetical protein
MAVYLLTEPLSDYADCQGIFHVAVFRIGLRHKLFVRVHGVVVVELVAQFLVELCEKAILDQGRWGSVDTWLALHKVRGAFHGVTVGTHLATREADGDDTELITLCEELWLNHGCGSHVEGELQEFNYLLNKLNIIFLCDWPGGVEQLTLLI